jgi:hypothetical protein
MKNRKTKEAASRKCRREFEENGCQGLAKKRKGEKQMGKRVRFQVLTAASMMFRVVFWDILPEDNSEQMGKCH